GGLLPRRRSGRVPRQAVRARHLSGDPPVPWSTPGAPTMSIARLLTPTEAERTQRLRARRIAIDVQKLGDVAASLRHGEVGALEGTVQDLSLHGLAVAVPQVAQQGLLM